MWGWKNHIKIPLISLFKFISDHIWVLLYLEKFLRRSSSTVRNNLLHRCYGRVNYAPRAMPRTTSVRVSQSQYTIYIYYIKKTIFQEFIIEIWVDRNQVIKKGQSHGQSIFVIEIQWRKTTCNKAITKTNKQKQINIYSNLFFSHLIRKQVQSLHHSSTY